MKNLSCTFRLTKKVLDLAEHAMKHHRHHFQPYVFPRKRVKQPSVLFVRDRGIYLVSPETNATAPRHTRLRNETDMLVCAYAEGAGPESKRSSAHGFGFACLIDATAIFGAYKNGARKMKVTIEDMEEKLVLGEPMLVRTEFL